MMEWLVNEKKIDDCWYCLPEDVCPDVPRGRVLTNLIQKMMPKLCKNPGTLKACMTDLERFHPWPRALANLLDEAADELLESSLSNSLLGAEEALEDKSGKFERYGGKFRETCSPTQQIGLANEQICKTSCIRR